MKIGKKLLTTLGIATLVSCTPQESPTEITSTDKNLVIENIMSRRSIRKYKDTLIEREKLDQIITCGINAPNGRNLQSWEVRVVDNPTLFNEIKENMAQAHPELNPEEVKGCFRGAPVMIFIARDTTYDFSAYDCGLMAQNIMLSAWSLGIGSICLGSPIRYLTENEACKPILQRMNFSENYQLCLCIGLGYADENPDAKPRDINKVQYLQ